MAYPPQQGQYGGHPQQPGPYGAPPRKDRAPLIASLIFVAALLAGVGITGFVAPGFFLSDDDSKGGGSTAGGSSAGGDSGGGDAPASGSDTPDGGDADLRAFADDLVAAANAKDKTALREFPCPDARSGVNQAIAEIVTIDSAELRGVSEVDEETYVVGVDITFQGRTAPFAATVTKSGDGWCWQDFAPGSGGSGGADAPEPGADPSSGPGSGPGSGSGGSTVDEAEAQAFAEEFVSALNAKDGATANGMYCPDATKGIVDYVVAKEPKLATAGTDTTEVFHTVMLTGTLDGKPLRRGKITVELKGGDAPCVFTFSAG